jgi:hypothetical protein
MFTNSLAADPRELGIPEDESAAMFKILSATGSYSTTRNSTADTSGFV